MPYGAFSQCRPFFVRSRSIFLFFFVAVFVNVISAFSSPQQVLAAVSIEELRCQCKVLQKYLKDIQDTADKEWKFLNQLKQALQALNNAYDYKAARNAYLDKMQRDMRSYMSSSEYKRMADVGKMQWQKLRMLKARQDLLELRQFGKSIRQALSRVKNAGKSLENLQRLVLDKAQKLARDCEQETDRRKLIRKIQDLHEQLRKARRWLCRVRARITRGYEQAWMEAGLSPLGFGLLEEVAIHSRTRDLWGVVNRGARLFGGVARPDGNFNAHNRGQWQDAGFGGSAEQISQAANKVRDLLQSHFGGRPPRKCTIGRIPHLSDIANQCRKKKKKKPSAQPATPALPGTPKARPSPPDTGLIVVRRKKECVGTVVKRVRFKTPGRLVVEAPEKGKPEGDPKIGVLEKPRVKERPRRPTTERLSKPKRVPTPTEAVERVKEAVTADEKRKDGRRYPTVERRPKKKEKPELGLVKAKKKVVELVLKGEDTGKAVPEGTIKLVDAAPKLPDEKETTSLGEVLEALKDLLFVTREADETKWLLKDLISQLDYLISLGDVFAENEQERARQERELLSLPWKEEDWKALEKSIREAAKEMVVEDPEKFARDLVKKIREHILKLKRERYADEIMKMVKSDWLGDWLITREEKPKRQKVVVLPGNAGKDAVERIAKVGKVRELPKMKHPRTGKPVKPLVVVIPDDPEAEKKLGKAAKDAGAIFIGDDPCPDKEGTATDVPNDPLYKGKGAWGQDFDNQWAIKRIGLTAGKNSAWAVRPEDGRRRRVVVAIIDSGLDWTHPDIDPAKLWRNPGEIPDNGVDDDSNGYVDDVIGWNFVDDNNLPWDQDGHGTFVAGVIGAATNNGYGIAGINPDATLMILKALGPFGSGYGSAVARAILYAVDNGADIINLSLGTGDYMLLTHMAINKAREKGVIVVVAAGNQAKYAAKHYPAGLPGVITVAATDRKDRRAGFSNWGEPVDIAAPGVDVLSLRARNTDLLAFLPGVDYMPGKGVVGEDGAFYRASGTSFAAPMVSGVLSLVLSSRPEVTRRQAVRMVLQSARDIETPGIDNYTGYGLLDAAAAVRADPEFFVESRISGVRLVKARGRLLLRVLGTADANRLARVQLFMGAGENPGRWRRLKKTLKKGRRDAALFDVPVGLLRGAGRWTLRLVVTHQNGEQRESRYALRLR